MNFRSMCSHALTFAACLAVLCATASIASACPSCQAALAGDEAHGDLARGIYYSVLFMMSMPFAIIGTFAGLAYRAVQRERRRVEAEQARQAEEQAEPPSERQAD